MGRKKIKMKKLENPRARKVAFCKRRQGIFKKAHELSVLCEAQVAVITFSPAGRLHRFSTTSNISDILGKLSLGLDTEQHPIKIQGEGGDCVDLSEGIEDKTNRLREAIEKYLERANAEELERLDQTLETKLNYVTARKAFLVSKAAHQDLGKEDSHETGAFRAQAGVNDTTVTKESTLDPISRMNLDASCFPYSPRTKSGLNDGLGQAFPRRWVPPALGVSKVNFAGVRFQDTNASGVGVVIRNWKCEFMAALSRFIPEPMDKNIISSRAAKYAVEFSIDYCFTNIELEGDARNIIQGLENTNTDEDDPHSSILSEAREHMRNLGGYVLFSQVQRTGNCAAHILAQYARNVGHELVWLIKEPDFLANVLQADAAPN